MMKKIILSNAYFPNSWVLSNFSKSLTKSCSLTHFPSSSVMAGAVPAFLISSSSFCFRQSSRDFFFGSSCSSVLVFLATTDGGRLSENDMVVDTTMLFYLSKERIINT